MSLGEPAQKAGLGSKSLALDPTWSGLPVDELEKALLRNAAFPELARVNNIAHSVTVLDPSASPASPGRSDLLERIAQVAERMAIPVTVMGNQAFRAGEPGFRNSAYELQAMDDTAFSEAFSDLRAELGNVLAGARFSANTHVFLPAFEGATLAVIVELISQIPASARPFVHLATVWNEATMPNISRFGSLGAFGRTIHALNTERSSTFVYAWSRSLAASLSKVMALPVQPLQNPPELSLSEDPAEHPESFVVGFYGAPTAAAGFDRIPEIVRATNRSATNPRRTRFVVQIRPGGQRLEPAALQTVENELASVPERNVAILDEFLNHAAYFAAIQKTDGLLLPYRGERGLSRVCNTALHAMAAGKIVFTFEGVDLPDTLSARVLTARDERALGEIISDVSSDVAAARASQANAKRTFWSTVRPSRLFAQLLYGPIILATAAGHDKV